MKKWQIVIQRILLAVLILSLVIFVGSLITAHYRFLPASGLLALLSWTLLLIFTPLPDDRVYSRWLKRKTRK